MLIPVAWLCLSRFARLWTPYIVADRACQVGAAELAVEPQQVVLGKAEAADGRFGADAAMRPMPVVAMKPSRQFGCAFVGSVVSTSVSPFA